MMPVSWRLRTRVPAPDTHILISLEALPPRTGRSCISTTCAPWRAAAIAANVPASPPPITQTSAVWKVFLSSLIINSFLRT